MIVIKNLEMPKHCWDCNLTYEDGDGWTICSLTHQRLYPMFSKEVREDDCPLVEIPLIEIKE